VEAHNSQSISTGFSQSEFLPLSLQRQQKKTLPIELLPTREKSSDKLMSIKSTYNNQVVWGTEYWELSANKSVIQLAWKGAQIVLFASTLALLHEQVVRLRKRPAATATGANITRKVFGDQPVKCLPIPTTVDDYNHSMGAVDQAAQLMTTYDTQRVKRKTWKPLFFFLLNVAINNAFLLSSQRTDNPTRAHKEFFEDLIASLFEASQKTFRGPNLAIPSLESPSPAPSDLPLNSLGVPSSTVAVLTSDSRTLTSIPKTLVPQSGERLEKVMQKHELVKLFHIAKSCQSCRLACKPRAPLAPQGLKAPVPRLPRRYYSCKVCREAICLKKKSCFLEHIVRARLVESRKTLARSESIK